MDTTLYVNPIPDFLKEKGITTPAAALRIVPSGYTDYTKVSVGFGGLKLGATVVLPVTLYSRPQMHMGFRAPLASFTVTDSRHVVSAAAWGPQAWRIYRKDMEVGDHFHIQAKIGLYEDDMQLQNVRLISPGKVGRYEAVYAGDAAGESVEFFEQAIADPDVRQDAVHDILRHFPGYTQAQLLDRCGRLEFRSLDEWLVALHTPGSEREAERAMELARRLAAFEVVAASEGLHVRQPVLGSALPLNRDAVAALVRQLPFTLTNDQSSALGAVCQDVTSEIPMRRLLSGDVGTGKTAVFATAAAATFLAGKQAVILVPNLLVCEQHIECFKAWWPHIPTQLVIGTTNLKPADLELRPVLIGTTALISRLKKMGCTPDFVVVDEQHKLSVEQREILLGPHTHLLEATATCIPRTVALLSHGGMDLSVLRDSPYKKNITTQIFDARNKRELFRQVSAIIQAGEQVAVVYPRIDAKDGPDTDKHAFEEGLRLWETHFPGAVAGIHGRMKAEEKKVVIQAMREKRFSVLVTTTVIEVGVDIPTIKACVVVGADRFGAAPLHQLRGRVSRHGGEGAFFMYLPNPVDASTRKRLEMLVHTNDGFRLAELDLQTRGFGDLSTGDRQSGKSRTFALMGVDCSLEALQAVVPA